MTRLLFLALFTSVALNASLPVLAQPKDPKVKEQPKVVEQPKVKEPPKEFASSIGMKFVWVPAGSFTMGSPAGEGLRLEDEVQHKVTLKGFYMGVFAVTQGEWQQVMGNNPSRFKGDRNLPVERVSWHDCQEFIVNLRDKDKKPYRLPSEAEWEYACRAGTQTPFSFGDTANIDLANFNGEVYGKAKKATPRGRTTPGGNFPPNAWGLYDMHGNVWQWCQDWYGAYPAKDGADPQGSDRGTIRVLRGGSWDSFPQFCRSACRYGDLPGERIRTYGFRICFNVE